MHARRQRGFTIVELLVVISIIAILAGLVLVAVSGSTAAARTAQTQQGLRDIATWMEAWSGDHDSRVLPSQFDYQDEAAAGTAVTVRADEHLADLQYRGTWTDLLWTYNNMHVTFALRDVEVDDPTHLTWESDSPDASIYDAHPDFQNPFRSHFENSRNHVAAELGPTPFADGAQERGLPGFFAANDFFDARSDVDRGDSDSQVDRYYTSGMIRAPQRSIYLVDSVAGETIAVEEDPWTCDLAAATLLTDGATAGAADLVGHVDFRYGESCMVLLLDGHVERLMPWTTLGLDDPDDKSTLQGQGWRVGRLHQR